MTAKTIHPIAGTLALITILGFWIATAASELFAGPTTVTLVKTLIPYGFFLLIPGLLAAGMSGMRLGRTRGGPLALRKKRRMPVIAVNGILILIPSALYLSQKAQAAAFDEGFYAVQALELAAGALNIALLGLNMRDGLRLAAGRRRAKAAGA